MKQKISILFYQLLLVVMMLPLTASAQTGRVINQIQFGKEEITVADGEVITFYDFNGENNLSEWSSKSQALTVFKSAVPGKVVMLRFDEFDLRSGGSYPGWVNIYSGVADADNSFTFVEYSGDLTKSMTDMPVGNLLEEHLEGKYTDKTYFSTSDDGALSVGTLFVTAATCSGFKATVQLVTPEDMQIISSGSRYDDVTNKLTGKQNIAFAGVYVETKGFGNPDNLTKIVFNASKNDNAVDITKLRLYRGRYADIDFKNVKPIETIITKLDETHFEMSMSYGLATGMNDFTLVGDFNQDAAIGAGVCIEADKIISTKTPAGIASFAKGQAVTVNVPAIELMQAGHTTVNVGETPVAFFDNGGVEGKSLISEGITTFVPAVAGKKVMIDFTKVSLFMAYDGNRKESLRIYNGKEVKEENLIKVITETNTCLVRSTSADGALTVRYTDENTAEYSKKDGFEAQVSLFTPQPMQLDGVTAERILGGKVCAGTNGVQIMKLCVNTSNTEPALTVNKFDFTTNNTFAIVSKAHLYYTKGTDKFGVLNEIGSADITADNFTITAAGAVPMVEGANYFWLVYDVKPEAQNGQKLSASVSSITLSDGVHAVENGNPAGELVIENVIVSDETQKDFTVFGSVAFKSLDSEYSSGHESGMKDQITTFRPAHKGKVISLDFSMFDLTYEKSSYGTKAKFIVYNGETTKGNVLWELNDPAQAKTGPGKILRSSTTDGAITIVFNPNTTSSYYCGKGFNAVVSEYESKVMVADSVVVSQAPDAVIAVGDKNVRILNLNIKTSGDKGTPSFEEMTLDLKGSEKAVDKVMLYRNDNEATPVAEKVITAEDKTVVLTLNAESLIEGDNLYNVRFDVKDAAKGGDILDAAVTSVKVAGAAVTVKGGDPAGQFEIKNIFNMKSGDNGIKTIAEGSSLSFFDDGGIDANASEKFEGTVTFAPAIEGQAIVFDFKQYDISYADEMTIWFGDDMTQKPDYVFGKYDKPKPLEITPITSKAANGKITVKYVTGGYPGAGFNITVSSKERKPLAISSVTAETVAPAGVMKGEVDVPMIKVAVNVEGDYKTTEVTKFELASYAQNVISDVNVYATGTNAEFSSANLFGTKKADSNVIDGSYTIDNAGIYYFFIAANVSTSATEGDAANVALKSVNDNAAAATAETSVVKGVSGTLTVGAGEQYNSIQEAIDALKGGVDGPVTINIKPGVYKECVKVPEIKGASANNTITLRSESGNYKDVKIYYDIYNEPSEYKDYYGTFTIDGADYFTLRGVEVTTTNTAFESVVHVKNHAQHVTIDSCYIHTKMCPTYSDGDISLVKTYAENIENRNNDYLTVTNCLFEGGNKGTYVGGTGFVKLPKQYEATIRGNKFVNQGQMSVYATDQLGIKIIDNEIINNATTASSFKAMDIKVRDLNDYDVEVSGNRINISAPTTHTVMYIREMKASAEHPARIYNNEVISTGGDADSYILTLGSDETANVEFAYNTFSMNSASATPLVYTNKVFAGNVSFVNNIFVNKQPERIFFLSKGVGAGTTFDSNVFSTAGENIATMNGAVKTFDEFVAETKAVNCYKENVTFCNENVLEPLEQGNLLSAKVLSYVTEDITGVQRAATPTIGAYEFNASTEAPVMAEGYPAVKNITDSTAVVVVNTNLSGKAYVLVLATDAAAPTAEVLKTTGVSADVVRGNENEINVEGLVKDAMYRAYVMVESYRGTQSAVAKTADFKASANQIVETPEPVVTTEYVTAEKGTMAVLKANVTSGTAPYTVEWKNSLNEVVATTTLAAAGETTAEIEAVESGDYTVVVTDKYKKQASEWLRLTVLGEASTATFENLYLDKESFWNGKDLRYSFVSGSYLFDNFYDEEYKYWGGFAYSNVTEKNFTSYADATGYANAVGSGYDGSANYAIINCFIPGTVTVMNSEEGDSIRGFYITNSASAYKAVKEGLAPARQFVKGDYLVLTIENGETGKTMEYYLADYRSENEADHYVLDTWQWVDLRELGKAKSLIFQVTGSDTGKYGLNTPAYFCMDNFNGHRVITEVPAQIIDIDGFDATINLAQFFTFDNDGSSIAYTIDEVLTDGEFNLSVSGSDLVINGKASGDFTVIVKAVQKGKIQFISVPVTFTTSLEGVEADEFQNVKYRYTIDGKRINTNSRKQGINIIRDNNGEVKKVVVK